MPATTPKRARIVSPAANAAVSTASQEGLSVTAYRGDGSVLLAFNLDKKPAAGFAGFAVRCTPPGAEKAARAMRPAET